MWELMAAFDRSTRQAWYWLVDSDAVHYWDRSTPLRQLIHWWAETKGLQVVHAGAVGASDGGVLVTGPGGSGKSTTTLACIEDGLAFAGDDTVLVADDPPWVHSLYGSGKLEVDHVGRFPGLMP